METLGQILPVIIYILLIGLIIICIIIGVKLIITMNKIERVVDDVENKVNSLNGLFDAINTTTNKVTGIYQKVNGFVGNIVDKILIGFKKRKDDDNYE